LTYLRQDKFRRLNRQKLSDRSKGAAGRIHVKTRDRDRRARPLATLLNIIEFRETFGVRKPSRLVAVRSPPLFLPHQEETIPAQAEIAWIILQTWFSGLK